MRVPVGVAVAGKSGERLIFDWIDVAIAPWHPLGIVVMAAGVVYDCTQAWPNGSQHAYKDRT